MTYFQSVDRHYRLGQHVQRQRKVKRSDKLKDVEEGRQHVGHVGSELIAQKDKRNQSEIENESFSEHYDSHVCPAHVRQELDLLDLQDSGHRDDRSERLFPRVHLHHLSQAEFCELVSARFAIFFIKRQVSERRSSINLPFVRSIVNFEYLYASYQLAHQLHPPVGLRRDHRPDVAAQ